MMPELPRRLGSALTSVMRHSATRRPLRTWCRSGGPTERSQRRRPRPHQAKLELDPTLLSSMVEPTERSQNWGMAPPLPARIGPVQFGELGGWVYTAIVQRADALRDPGSQRLARRWASYWPMIREFSRVTDPPFRLPLALD